MRLNRSISIVVALPLVFMLVVCGTVYFYSLQLDKLFSKQQNLSQALSACQSYISLMLRAGATLAKLGDDKSKNRFTGYRDHFKEIEEGNAQLKRIAELVPGEKAAVDSILSTNDEFRSLTKELVQISSIRKGKQRDSRSLMTVFELIDHTRKRFSLLKEVQSRLLSQYVEAVRAGENLRVQFDIFGFVLFSTCAAAVLTFFAALFVQRRIINRLNLLAVNTHRFMTRKAQPVPLLGDDEIAEVDQALHAMVNETNEILKRERAVIDSTRAAIFSADEMFAVQTESPSCSKLWSNLETEENVRLPERFADETWKAVKAQLDLARKEEHPVNFTLCLAPEVSGGLKRTFFSSAAWNAMEKQYFCTFTDISASEQKRDEIRSREERIRTLMELMPSALLLLGDNGRIQMCNASASQLLSRTSSELVGQPITEFLTLQSEHADVATLLEFCKGKVTEATLTTSQSELMHAQMTVDSFDSSSWLLVLIDVNERYKLEEARRNIVSVIAHDIRTPLTSMLANMDLLLTLGKERAEISQNGEILNIRKTCKVLTSLINELLTIQRFGQPGVAVQSFKMCPLDELLNEPIDAVFDDSMSRGVVVDYESTSDSAGIDIERSQQCIIKILKLLIATSEKGSRVLMEGSLKMQGVESVVDIRFEASNQKSETVSLADFFNSEKRQPDQAVEVSVLNTLLRNLGARLVVDGEFLSLQIPVLRSILFEASALNDQLIG